MARKTRPEIIPPDSESASEEGTPREVSNVPRGMFQRLRNFLETNSIFGERIEKSRARHKRAYRESVEEETRVAQSLKGLGKAVADLENNLENEIEIDRIRTENELASVKREHVTSELRDEIGVLELEKTKAQLEAETHRYKAERSAYERQVQRAKEPRKKPPSRNDRVRAEERKMQAELRRLKEEDGLTETDYVYEQTVKNYRKKMRDIMEGRG